jgi:hypothetical protein
MSKTATSTDLSSSPSPAFVGEPVTFNAVVAAVEGFRAPTGTVTFSIDGDDQAPVALTSSIDPAASDATFTTSALTQGTYDVTARYSGDAHFGVSSAELTVEVVVADGPRVVAVGVKLVGHFPRGLQVTVTFNEDLNPVPAQSVANYSLKLLRNAPVPPIAIAIQSAVYDRALRTVTLLCLLGKKPLPGHRLLVINGTTPSGISDVSGRLLDGAGTGRPGSDFMTLLS